MSPDPSPVRPDRARAAVTGLGVVAPNGVGARAWWQATLRGVSALRPARDAPVNRVPVAGEVTSFVAEQHLPSRLLPQTARFTRLALAAAAEALDDADVDRAELGEYGTGVYTASSAGGYEFGQHEMSALWRTGSDSVSAYQSFAWFYAACTGQVSIRHGLRGTSGTLVTEQCGGLDAVGQARRRLGDGARVLLAGGSDAALCPLGWAGHLATGRVSPHSRPDRAYLPFHHDASGYVPGEGAAYVVLEERAAAEERGAEVLGEIAGYAAAFDPPTGPGNLGRAARLALEDAGLLPDDIDVVFADGSGVPELDEAEAEVITDIFGPYGVPVSVPKTMTGRIGAGGSTLDLAAALLTLREGVIPPAAHVDRPKDGWHLDLVTTAPRPAEPRAALVLARGHGGFNSAAVVVK
ncbi:actinorhodin polyketide putative beta-ketoacyl synthase 2 [Streptomyces sp. NBRC 14336]|uniref:beta-ketoacyl synthase N-terminal-like domain-containing protein n=1 Tax=Streptomyces sp. NBRC 14336 TaxID=3030992 RepID=UPI0024A49B90|nr:beta-ketoacyl synthase N-terminal-like domain-containing protein [Streptomyces sp. NBRC 14336]WBO80955.1 ketosynthase chain-length factor [Streptomyces sp. SBE_14.2]GLW48217.1 actinorhodin polyketide putative beta-ketoacyl synthase 2 [Streptomyces sp. NBRC 14336]